MDLKKISFISLLMLLELGCVSDFNAVLPSSMENILVVEGDIMENTDATFYLSEGFSLSGPEVPVKNMDANVTIVGSNGYQSEPATNLGKGAFRIAVGELDDNVSYGLQIEYDGHIYKSTLTKPMYASEIDSVSWAQEGGADGTVSIRVSTHDTGVEPVYYRWNYDETWEITVPIETTAFYDPEKGTFFDDYTAPYLYCWMYNTNKNILVGSTESLLENRLVNIPLFKHPASNIRFDLLYSINVTQQAITKPAYEYYLNRKSLNEDMGGLFTPQPSELAGNISCATDPSKRVIGYVNVAKNRTQKRMFVHFYELETPGFGCGPSLSSSQVEAHLDSLKISLFDFYKSGYRPIAKPIPFSIPTDRYGIWARATCTDCRERGGTKLKPDYWPNDHE